MIQSLQRGYEPFVPIDEAAESRALACVFVSELREEFLRRLEPQLFATLKHRAIFEALRSTIEEGLTPDFSTVAKRIREVGVNERDLEELPIDTVAPGNFYDYVEALVNAKDLRRLADSGIDLLNPTVAKRVLAVARTLGHEDSTIQLAPSASCLGGLARCEQDAASELLRDRYLCRGGNVLICGATGVGKSSFEMQGIIYWAAGKPFFGIHPVRPLSSLLIQAENDDGDLSEMRDGILSTLKLSSEDQDRSLSRILVYREDTKVGSRFFKETVKPLLAKHLPDLLWIDPALSYLAGDTSSQQDVGGFLRNQLNPLLREFNCGGIIVHHTNKPPSSKNAPRPSVQDFAYLGSGSAEWANWARAILVLRGTSSHGVFELHAAKRGNRIGWQDRDGAPVLVRRIAHSNQPGVIFWRECEPGGVDLGGRPKKGDTDTIIALLPDEGLTTSEWEAQAEEKAGIKRTRFLELMRELEEAKCISKPNTRGKWTRLSPQSPET